MVFENMRGPGASRAQKEKLREELGSKLKQTYGNLGFGSTPPQKTEKPRVIDDAGAARLLSEVRPPTRVKTREHSPHVKWDDKVNDSEGYIPPNKKNEEEEHYRKLKLELLKNAILSKRDIRNSEETNNLNQPQITRWGGAKISFYIDGKKRTQNVYLNKHDTKCVNIKGELVPISKLKKSPPK